MSEEHNGNGNNSDVANNGRTTGGVTGKGFLPGQSGNPSGRTKGFGAYIREKTKDGKLQVDDALAVLENPKATDAANAEARTFLGAYGFGKPVETQDINMNVTEWAQRLALFIDPAKRTDLARYLTGLKRGDNN